MRILHILDHSPPLASGYVYRTLAILRHQRALGWETLHVTTPRHGAGTARFDDFDGLRFHRTHSTGPLQRLPGGKYAAEMAATARRIDELCREFAPDVLHAHSPVLNALPTLAVGRRRRIPVVYEMRASWEDAAVDHGSTVEGSLRYRASRALETFALKRSAAITTICEGLRADIVARGIDAQRVTVIPNAVDVEAFSVMPPDAEARTRLGVAGCDVVGFAGSFYSYEGLDLAIDALHALRERRPHLRLLLAGGGPQMQALQTQATGLGLSDRVLFTGRVPHAEVQRIYSAIDLLVYPRRSMRLTELVTPLKPLEAMAQGKPVLASDIGGHRELIRAGETGWLFPPGNAPALAQALDEVLSQRAQWPQITTNALRFVHAERTWTRSVARYADVYSAIRPQPSAATAASARGT